jgi:hypothetical protein
LCVPVALAACAARAQEPGPEDEMIQQISELNEIGAADQERIRRAWVEPQIERYTNFAAFRKRFRDRYTAPSNTPEFSSQFAAQTAAVAATRFRSADLRPEVAVALAQVLADLNRAETHPGLIAGLKSPDARARYLCAKALSRQTAAISGDPAMLRATVEALREAGLAETDPVVLGRIYAALAIPGQLATVFDAYLALFDKRLETKRQTAIREDGAELWAFEFFRTSGTLGALTAEQKAQLAARLAVFLRMAAERYQVSSLKFTEIDRIERTLEGAEEILVQLVGSRGGNVCTALSEGATENRAAVLEQAYRWVGRPGGDTRGVLNDAPWNVPAGAP